MKTSVSFAERVEMEAIEKSKKLHPRDEKEYDQ